MIAPPPPAELPVRLIPHLVRCALDAHDIGEVRRLLALASPLVFIHFPFLYYEAQVAAGIVVPVSERR